MKRLLIALCLTGMLATTAGCYGQFALTKKVHQWNGSVSGDKFVHTLVFWAMIIVPVYEVVMLADGLVFNTIEFWSGSNPLENMAPIRTSAMADGSMVFETAEHHYRLQPRGSNAVQVWVDGQWAGTAERATDGSVAISNPMRGRMMHISAEEVIAMQR